MKPSFAGWIPIRVYWKENRPMVDWCLLGNERFIDPFFESTVQRRLRHPFHQAFRRQTPVEALEDWHAEQPGVAPAGFLFHMSRCGSTLVSQLLSSSERNIVFSEALPVDSILRAHFRDPACSEARRAEWLRWLVSALGQKRHGAEEQLFIKFDCWSIAELPVIRLAFPGVPWIFLYRNPIEVLVSQLNQPAGWSFPGMLHPAVLGMQADEVAKLPHDEYCARALARICEFALFHLRHGDGMPVNYSQLPEFVWSKLTGYFGVQYGREDLGRMQETAQFDAKTPNFPFEHDTEKKRSAATERIRELVARWMQPSYEQLERVRLSPASLAGCGKQSFLSE